MKVDYFESGVVKTFTFVTEVNFRNDGQCEIKFKHGKDKLKPTNIILSISE